MSDQTIETPGDVPDQQLSGQQTPDQQAAYWEARYKGTGPIINKLTQERDSLRDQVAQLTSEIEQLRAQLSLKDTEKSAALEERDKQIKDLVAAQNQKDADLRRLQSMERKLKVTKELNAPQLIDILDTVPDIEDESVLKNMMENILNWGNSLAKSREQELLAGVTGGGTPAPATKPVLPSTVPDWVRYINEAPDGSQDRRERMKQFREWGASQS